MTACYYYINEDEMIALESKEQSRILTLYLYYI